MGQDQPRAGQPGGHRLSQRERAERGSERARLRPRRLRLHDLHRQFGPLAEPISKAINDKDLVAVSVLSRQPQLRRARVARLPGQLSRLAAAGGRFCAQGHGPLRHGQRADRDRHQRQAGVPQGHLADECGSPRAGRRPRPFGHVPQTLCRRLSRRRALARDRGHRQRDLQLAARIHLHPEPALFHRHDDDAGAAAATSSAPGPWRSSGIRSPPTTSRPPERSSPTVPPAVTFSSTRSAAANSTATARAAGTTK